MPKNTPLQSPAIRSLRLKDKRTARNETDCYIAGFFR